MKPTELQPYLVYVCAHDPEPDDDGDYYLRSDVDTRIRALEEENAKLREELETTKKRLDVAIESCWED